MPQIHFSQIAVIESLENGKTGRRLYDDLQPIKIVNNLNIGINYYSVNTKSEFFSQLIELKKEAKNGKWPILHIECHGLEDKSGIMLANDEYIKWSELKPYLTAINIETQCNLFVVLAGCYGGHLVQILQPTDVTPCLGILSPTKKMFPDEILKPLTTFYCELLTSLDLNVALKKLRSHHITEGGYYFKTAPDFFSEVFAGYLNSYTNPKALKNRTQDIYNELKQSGIFPPGGMGAIKKKLKQEQRPAFEKYHKQFFMIDIYPENSLRFSQINFDDLQKKVKSSY